MTAPMALLPATPVRKEFRWRPILALAAMAVALAWYLGGSAEPEIAEPVRIGVPKDGREATSVVASARLGFPERSVADVSADLFAQHSWYVPPPPAPAAMAGPPPAPSAPAFPYKFFGRYERVGERSVFVLTQGDRTFDVHVGDVLDNTWSIDAADGGRLQVTYLPLKQSQALAIWSTQ